MASTLVKSSISAAIGESLIQDIFLGKSKFYYSIGRAYNWNTEDIPTAPIDTEKNELQTRKDSLFYKRIEGTSLSFVINRVDYKANTIYSIYDDSISIDGKNYYVLTSDFNVYKCLYNANGKVSTIEPFGTSNRQITYSDGYVWKFIYTIPPALRTKFLTPESMPIYNAITERYYSRGSLTSIIINSSGAGYDPADTFITINGDGYQEFNPYKIVNYGISNNGAGYTTVPTVTTADIFTNNVAFVSGAAILIGQNIKVSDTSGVRFYRALNSGNLGTSAPTHYYSENNSGTTLLKHIGTQPLITASIVANSVGAITIVDPGFGYVTNPLISKSSPGSGATFSTTVVGGVLAKVNVLTYGSGYTTTSATVQEPYANTAFAQSTLYAQDDIVSFVISGSTYYYQVTTGGTSGASNPSHITGSAINGTAVLSVIGKRAKVVAILGNVSAVNITSDVEKVAVTAAGTGYVQSSTTVTFTGGSPISPAIGTVTVTAGKIDRVDVTYPGYGYLTTPSIVIGGVGTGANLTPIMQQGYGYQSETDILFSDPNTAGVTATAKTVVIKTEASLTPYIVSGKIRGVNIVDPGIGYTSAKLTVIGSGTGAQLSALFAPGDLSTIQAQNELLAIPGTLSSTVVTEQGSNISAISCEIVGDGTGAVISPIVKFGKLVELLVVEEGQGYTNMEINISVNSDAPIKPTARAILSPVRGHASNPIREFHTKSVALYSTFSSDSNNGFLFDNSFRQVSIIKNPSKFNSSFLLEGRSASTCYNITAGIGAVPLSQGMILTNLTTNDEFRVISFNNTNILAEQLGTNPVLANDVYSVTINSNVQNIISTSVTPPQVDKYSGDILYIDNLKQFSPTTNSAVSVSTIINLV